jgi:phosphoglycolate phosphatase
MRCAIFDLDGTLVDSSSDLVSAGNAALREMGLPEVLDARADGSTALRGGGRAMLRLGFARAGQPWSEEGIEAAYPLFLKAYEARIDETTAFHPGALASVESLRDLGWTTGICTNKSERLADLLLRRLGARELFDSLVGADTLHVRKPDPAPLIEAVTRTGGRLTHAALIGDTATDRETARAAGVASILITFGPDGRGVEELAPHGLLDRFDDLPNLMEELFGEALVRAVGGTD